MRGCILFLMLVIGFSASAQQYNPDKISKKNRSIYDKALSFAEDLRYTDALNLINIALDNDPSFLEARLSKAGILGELKFYRQAAEEYKIALDTDQDFCQEYLLPYSINLAGAGEFEKALQALEAFMSIRGLNESSIQSAAYRKRNLLFALQQQKKTGVTMPLAVVNAGSAINSTFSEYFPSMTVEGDQLVWTRRVSDLNEDFYISQKAGGVWQTGAPMTGEINTPMKEGAQQISQDGKWLVFAGQYPDSYGRFDLYLSLLTESGWSLRQNLGERINSEFWESSPCLSPDKRELYFSSDRPGGFGGIDIYVSRRMANGSWSIPENLGPAINTSGDESSPFLHADNETLYFSSNGLQGYGGADLFKAKRGPQGFGDVQNLGYPVNTIDNEGSLFVASDGATAWMASNRADSKGGLDIYYFNLPEATRPVTTSWVRGKVYDSITGNGLMAEVELIDLGTKQVVAQVMTDQEGRYLCTLPCDRRYAFMVNKKGYLFHSQLVFVNKTEGNSGFTQDIPLMPMRAGFSAVLQNVLFETGKYNLLPESVVELDKLVALMKEQPGLKIEISGHTDNTGVESVNVELSSLRAKAVADYIISKGVAVSQLTSKGYGSSMPVADNNTPEGRQLNRRTAFMIISER